MQSRQRATEWRAGSGRRSVDQETGAGERAGEDRHDSQTRMRDWDEERRPECEILAAARGQQRGCTIRQLEERWVDWAVASVR